MANFFELYLKTIFEPWIPGQKSYHLHFAGFMLFSWSNYRLKFMYVQYWYKGFNDALNSLIFEGPFIFILSKQRPCLQIPFFQGRHLRIFMYLDLPCRKIFLDNVIWRSRLSSWNKCSEKNGWRKWQDTSCLYHIRPTINVRRDIIDTDNILLSQFWIPTFEAARTAASVSLSFVFFLRSLMKDTSAFLSTLPFLK